MNNTDIENLNLLRKLFNEHPKHFNRMLSNKNGEYYFLYQWLIEKTPLLDSSYNIATRCNWIFTNRKDFPTCPICKNQFGIGKNVKVSDGYGEHCSYECAHKDENLYKKQKQTNLLRYGDEYPSRTKEVKEKIKKTNIEKYGVENISQLESIKQLKEEKMRKTLMERYGVSRINDIPGVTEKISKSNKKAFAERREQILEKIHKTSIEKYGCDHYQNNPQVKNKRETTNIKKYGSKCSLNNQMVQDKIKRTNKEKYGDEVPVKLESYRQYLRECCKKKIRCVLFFRITGST